ncbi:MAG TPA: TIGR00730 family Rossman fold protein [Candidatus Scatomorpha pullicola]|nr:TIGR00730 family Rossman fold protein [Candidatus Scatomorpha pullicola]
MKICVFGASSRDLEQGYFDEAFALGAELARRGHTIVFGGGASGLMGATARGAKSRGGRLIGIAPKFFDEPGILDKDCDEMIFTETMSERKKAMEDMSEAFITLPGGIGTFEEFFEALTLKQLGRHAKAMAVLNTLGYYDALEAMVQRAVDERFLTADGKDLYAMFTDVGELVSYVENYHAEPEEIWKDKLFGKYSRD